jgi:hypothetical protein
MMRCQQVTVAVKDNGWDGKDETDEAALQWSFAGSLLYAVTVVTTIGKFYRSSLHFRWIFPSIDPRCCPPQDSDVTVILHPIVSALHLGHTSAGRICRDAYRLL